MSPAHLGGLVCRCQGPNAFQSRPVDYSMCILTLGLVVSKSRNGRNDYNIYLYQIVIVCTSDSPKAQIALCVPVLPIV
jgi:hypothetical protein